MGVELDDRKKRGMEPGMQGRGDSEGGDKGKEESLAEASMPKSETAEQAMVEATPNIAEMEATKNAAKQQEIGSKAEELKKRTDE